MKPSKTLAASVDLRGFSYALEPYLRKQEWRLEALQVQMGQAAKAVAHARLELDKLDAALQAHKTHIAQALMAAPDPQAHRNALAFLAQCQRYIGAAERRLDGFKSEQRRLQAECIAQQRTIEGLQEHRQQAQQEFANHVIRQEAAETDRNWLARTSHLAAQRAVVEAIAP